jgi:ZIP family zinc transporter
MVFLMKNTMNKKAEKILLGFASGVMIAASVWSLLIPSINMAEEQGKVAWIPATIGFLFGIVFLLTLDSLIPHLHLESDKPEGIKSKLKKTTMMVLAVTLHNIPEGMAVGVTFAGALIGNAGITMAGAFTLAIGIAIQNFPEGAIISMPLKSEGMSKSKAFLYGTLSGIVEPIGAVITLLLTNVANTILPYLLAFAAGAMIYVVVEELIPESQAGEHSNIGTIGVAIGFVIMMILDVALG